MASVTAMHHGWEGRQRRLVGDDDGENDAHDLRSRRWVHACTSHQGDRMSYIKITRWKRVIKCLWGRGDDREKFERVKI